jgi:hypothetical protein
MCTCGPHSVVCNLANRCGGRESVLQNLLRKAALGSEPFGAPELCGPQPVFFRDLPEKCPDSIRFSQAVARTLSCFVSCCLPRSLDFGCQVWIIMPDRFINLVAKRGRDADHNDIAVTFRPPSSGGVCPRRCVPKQNCLTRPASGTPTCSHRSGCCSYSFCSSSTG